MKTSAFVCVSLFSVLQSSVFLTIAIHPTGVRDLE